ncbi:hypothetical protein [Streptomyces mutomycini]|uniref:Uncharacterized protein n=1 Tax=Streptomyces mutomycini TaxID=284036 RepID=A0ABW0B0P6_9ACTN|nr:hypothetical protein [Streptomyces mutomycini]
MSDVLDPVPAADEILVDGLAVGVCGTDKETAAGVVRLGPTRT